MSNQYLPQSVLQSPAADRAVEIDRRRAPVAMPPVRTPHLVTPDSVEWAQDPLDPRRLAARLVGDPTLPGPYVVRLRAPAGYDTGLHVHRDEDEYLTVISGSIRWTMGEPGKESPARLLKAGAFAMTPAGIPHRIVAVTDSVVQLSGVGPRRYIYLDGAATH